MFFTKAEDIFRFSFLEFDAIFYDFYLYLTQGRVQSLEKVGLHKARKLVFVGGSGTSQDNVQKRTLECSLLGSGGYYAVQLFLSGQIRF